MTTTPDLTPIPTLADRLRANVRRVVVSKDGPLDLVLVALLCNGHIMVQDVPGIGKTTLARTLAQSLGLSFKRIQFTPDLTPVDVLGTNIYNQRSGEFDFHPGPIFARVLLADEINRATPRTQSALLEAMQERQVTVDGVTRALPAPFLVVATQNPIEMEGTFPLPEAQTDRFMLRVALGYPSLEDEGEILLRFQRDATAAPEAGAVVSPEGADGSAGPRPRRGRGGLGAGVPPPSRASDQGAPVPGAGRQPSRCPLPLQGRPGLGGNRGPLLRPPRPT